MKRMKKTKMSKNYKIIIKINKLINKNQGKMQKVQHQSKFNNHNRKKIVEFKNLNKKKNLVDQERKIGCRRSQFIQINTF